MKRILQITILIFLVLLCSSAWATNYFVKDDGNNGNTGLSDAQAWLTITYALGQMSGGDDLYFKCDDTWTETIQPASSIGGTSGNRTIFGAYHGNGTIGVAGTKPIINGGVNTGYAVRLRGQTYTLNYITITNLQLRHGTHSILIRDADYTIIENCVVGLDAEFYGIYINSSPYSIVRYNTINAEYVTYPPAVFKTLWDGVFVINGSNYVEIYENVITDWGHTGIGLDSSANCTVKDNYITGPNSTYMRAFALNNEACDNVVERNYFYDLTVKSQLIDGSQGNVIKNNIFDTMRTTGDSSERYHFQFYSGSGNTAHTTGNYLINNTFYAAFGGGIHFYDIHATWNVYDNYIGNNIILNSGTYGIDKPSAAGDQYFYNNQVYNSTTANYRVNGTTYTAANFNAIGARYADNLDTDPGLSNPAGGEFWPDASTDACVNTGYAFADVTVGLKYDSTWTPTIAVNTVVRPQGSDDDIGPYEYVFDADPPPNDYANYTAWIRLEQADFSAGVTAESEEAPAASDQVWTLSGSAFNTDAKKLGINGLDCPSEDHAELTNASDYWNDAAPDGSFAFWFRPVSLPSARADLFYIKNGVLDSYSYVGCNSDGTARLVYAIDGVGNQVAVDSASAVFTANTWHYVEVRVDMDSDSLKVDVDNVNAITDTTNITPFTVTLIYLGDYFNGGSSDFHFDSFTISSDPDEDHYESRDSDVWPGKTNTDTVGLTDLGYWDGSTCDVTNSDTFSTVGNLTLCHTTEREFNVPPGTEYAPTWTILVGPEAADELVCTYAGYEDVAGGTGVIKWNCALVATHRSTALKSKAAATAVDLQLETAQSGATFTKAAPGVVTLASHGYADGDTVTISNTNAGECPEFEDAYRTITYINANSFSIGSTTGCTAAETSGCDFQRCPTVFRDINDNYLDPASAPNEDIASLVVAIPGAFTICASGCDITAHSDLVSQVDGDVLYMKDHTENLTITASNMVFQGSGYDLTGTVTFNVGADDNVINCLNISGAVTDNGSGNIVREHCPVSTQTGPRNFSPFF